jgi:hypothetical protein
MHDPEKLQTFGKGHASKAKERALVIQPEAMAL